MTGNTPLVSIGLPVFNGERFVGAAIQSVLAQSFADLELIVCDNASTDSTEAICREIAARDSRVRYFRNEQNLGAAPNFNKTVALARGEFFKWIAADAEIKPQFISACLEALRAHPDAVLACTKYLVVKPDGSMIVPAEHLNRLALMQETPSKRLQNVLPLGVLPIWGLMRLDVLRKTKMIRSIVSGDTCLILDLAIKGKFVQVPEFHSIIKRHQESYTDRLLSSRYRVEGAREAKWFDARNKRRPVAPRWQALAEALRTALGEQLPIREKAAACTSIIASVGWGWRRRLVKEVAVLLGLGDVFLAIRDRVRGTATATSN